MRENWNKPTGRPYRTYPEACKHCGGSGYINHYYSMDTNIYSCTCMVCNGSGVITVIEYFDK